MTGTDDERFAEIVAGFGKESDDPVPRWPVAEDVSDSPAPDQASSPLAGATGEAELPGWLEPDALPDDGHFEPPPAPRVPRVRPRTALALAMLLFGLAVVFTPYQIGLDDSTGWMLIGLLLTVGGAGLLVWWMRDAPPTDSDPDTGAVV